MRIVILLLIAMSVISIINDLCDGCISKQGNVLFPNSVITPGD